jgi:hypothetical protein
MAATPCLLAGFASARTARFPQRVAEPPPAADAEWVGQAGLFAAGLLTYVWQMGRRDALRAALCGAGTAAAQGDELSFMRIRGLAARAAQHIEARFSGRTRFWPDLVRAVRDGQPEGIRLARLTAIQLATSEYRANFDPPPSLYKPRVGSSPAGMR